MASRASIRASDADRERVAEQLRRAGGEGRLQTEELEQRLEATFAARTYGQLDAVLCDLPATRRAVAPRARRHGVVMPALTGAAAVMVLVLAAIVVVLVATGVFAGWLLWLLVGWWFWGRHRRSGPWSACHRYPRRGGRVHPGRIS